VYLGIRQYQLHFDFTGLGILCAIIAVLGALVWQLGRGHHATSSAIAALLLSLCALQIHRGYMVPDSAWLVMLGAVEASNGHERDKRIQELGEYWSTEAETMRASDWYVISKRWGVCHTLWTETKCLSPTPSEDAAGVAREILNGLVISSHRRSSAQ
jgi:hypothetical protein